MTTIIAPAPELVWTCDERGNWYQEERYRIRHGDGWREIRLTDMFAELDMTLDELRKPIAAALSRAKGGE